MTVTEAELAAALKHIPDQHISLGHWEPGVRREDMRKALEAARPLIVAEARAAERQRIRQLAIETEAVVPQAKCNGEVLSWHKFADLLDGDDGD